MTINNNIKVPFLDLKAQYAGLKSEIQEAVDRVLDNTAFILGPEVSTFEKDFAEFCDASYAIGVSSGTSALEMILRAYNIGPGDEVITVANTFIATVLPITYVGAKPVLIDMDPETWLIDLSKIEEKITNRTRAIIPVHLFGIPVDLDPILEIAQKHNLIVIEDACQAHGAKYKGKRVGGIGQAAAFSFYPGKNLGAYGDGGMITTNDAKIAERLRKMRDYGQSKKYHHDEMGYNSRLDAIQAAVLGVKLKYLDKWNESRREKVARYTQLLSETQVILPLVDSQVEPVWHLFVVQAEERDRLIDYLTENNVSTGIHYPIPIHLQKSYQNLGYSKGSFPYTEMAADKIISLPIYAEMTDEQLEYVVQLIKSFN